MSWFMEFDHISIGITNEKEHGTSKFNKFCDRYVMTIELTLNCLQVSYFQCNVSEAGMFG